MLKSACLLLLTTAACALQPAARPAASRTQSRRAALGSGALAAAALAAARLPRAALADTPAAMEGSMAGFDAGEIKRAKYSEMQKLYKKQWRKELSNLEFSSSDTEVRWRQEHSAVPARVDGRSGASIANSVDTSRPLRSGARCGQRDRQDGARAWRRHPAGRAQAGPRPSLQARQGRPLQAGAQAPPPSAALAVSCTPCTRRPPNLGIMGSVLESPELTGSKRRAPGSRRGVSG